MRLHLLAGALAAAAFALVGCSSSGTPSRTDAVAQLPSTAPTTGVTSGAGAPLSPSATPRPRSKLFETDQEQQADLVPYANCMRAHHVPVTPYGRPLTLNGNASLRAYVAADRVCADMKPLPPIQEDASNPKALIFNRAVAACLRSHGVSPVTIDTSNGFVSIAFGDGAATLGLKYIDRCQHLAAEHNR